MAGELLLDTNAIIAQIAGDPALSARIFDSTLYVPVPALGELYFGAQKSNEVVANLLRLDRYAANTVVVPVDLGTARIFGQIRHALKAKGRPIPANDMWIASLALQFDLPLVTRDKHFEYVDGLQLIKW